MTTQRQRQRPGAADIPIRTRRSCCNVTILRVASGACELCGRISDYCVSVHHLVRHGDGRSKLRFGPATLTCASCRLASWGTWTLAKRWNEKLMSAFSSTHLASNEDGSDADDDVDRLNPAAWEQWKLANPPLDGLEDGDGDNESGAETAGMRKDNGNDNENGN